MSIDKPSHKVICIGHRGAKGHETENTLKSFQKALDLGVTWVEFDVWAVDGQVFVFHDHRLERMTNGTGLIKACRTDYLRGLIVGEDQKIPLLEEVLDLVLPQASVNIEIKGAGSADLVFQVVQKYFRQGTLNYDTLLISSFNHLELKRIKQLDADIKIGALVCGVPENLASFAEKLGAYSVNQAIDYALPEFIEDARKRNLKVFVYTANHPEDIANLIELNVDGIFSDYPDVALKIMDDLGVS